MIEQHNRDINTNSENIEKKIKEAGFSNTILKGQGISLLYPNPLHRMPGDIDIWLEGGREKIMTFVRQIFPNAGARYHHVDFPVFSNSLDQRMDLPEADATNPGLWSIFSGAVVFYQSDGL